MDLLGSILGSMEKPPSIGDEEKKKRKAQKARQEKMIAEQKRELNKYREKVEKIIEEFIKDGTQQKRRFDDVDKTSRSVIHEAAEVAGLTSFSFGQDEVDRYVMIWKKEFAPSDDELAALRRGEEWTAESANDLQQQRLREKQEAEEAKVKAKQKFVPNTNYKEKYERLIGKEAAKDAAKMTMANRSYGFVPSENKRDLRTIEQVMADNKAKRQKTHHDPVCGESSQPDVTSSQPDVTSLLSADSSSKPAETKSDP